MRGEVGGGWGRLGEVGGDRYRGVEAVVVVVVVVVVGRWCVVVSK